MQVKNELDADTAKTIFDTFRQEIKYFKHFTSEEIKKLSELMKSLKIFRGDTLTKCGERLTWVGIILLGQVGVYQNTQKLLTLGVGDIIGYMSSLPGITHHSLEMTVLQNGYMSIITTKEMQTLASTNPSIVFKLMYGLSMKVLDIISLQYSETVYYPEISFVWADVQPKTVQMHINNSGKFNALADEFFHKNEKRSLQTVSKILHLNPGSLLVKRGVYERCVFIVVKGDLCEMSLTQNWIREGTILGLEQFFYGIPWPADIIAQSECELVSIHREIYIMMTQKSPIASQKVYRFLHKIYMDMIKENTKFKDSPIFDIDLRSLIVPSDPMYALSQNINPQVLFNNLNVSVSKNKEINCYFPNWKIQKQQEEIKLAKKKEKMQVKKKPEAKPEEKNPQKPEDKKNPKKFERSKSPNKNLETTKSSAKNLKTSKSDLKKTTQKKKEKQEKPEPTEEEKRSLAKKKTESGYIDYEEELEDLLDFRQKVQIEKKALLTKLDSLQKRNEELKFILKNKKEFSGILDVK